MSEVELQLAMQHHRAGRSREAESGYRRVIQARPTCREAAILLGSLLSARSLDNEAAEVYRTALRSLPDDADLLDELAVVCTRMREFAEAEHAARRDVELEPQNALFHIHLGNVLAESDRPNEALPCYARALELAAAAPLQQHADEAYYNLGVALHQLGRLDEATDALERAIALSPDFPEAHAKLGMTRLLAGDTTRGWAEYEWRLLMRPPPPLPRWDGSDLAGHAIVLDSDQGMGDAIEMIRYAPLVKQRGAGRVIVRCQPPLHRLVRAADGVDEVISTAAPQPTLSSICVASMMSLPHLLDDAAPAVGAYLRPDEADVARWKNELGGDTNMRVGLVWSGNPEQRDNPRRSIPPEQLRPLGDVPGVSWYRLQLGDTPAPFTMVERTRDLHDLAETAALIANLDLVVTTCTCVAHLAAATGRPTWVLLSRVPDFRWRLDRDDSPWYPNSVRLFRQTRAGDWSDPVARVSTELARRATSA